MKEDKKELQEKIDLSDTNNQILITKYNELMSVINDRYNKYIKNMERENLSLKGMKDEIEEKNNELQQQNAELERQKKELEEIIISIKETKGYKALQKFREIRDNVWKQPKAK